MAGEDHRSRKLAVSRSVGADVQLTIGDLGGAVGTLTAAR
jgi:hypothetical protein